MSDNVNHPQHYNQLPNGIECIDVIEHFSCCPANALKYIWRAGLKGDAITDYKKAIWYLEREIERLEKEQNKPIFDPDGDWIHSGSRVTIKPTDEQLSDDFIKLCRDSGCEFTIHLEGQQCKTKSIDDVINDLNISKAVTNA